MNSLLTEKAIDYAWFQLAKRAGVVDEDPLKTGFNDIGVTICYGKLHPQDSKNPIIIVIPCKDSYWDELLIKPPNSLVWLPAKKVIPPNKQLPIGNSVPVLFWGEGYENTNSPFAEILPDGSLVFYVDIIASTFFMLSRWEETQSSECDEHGRFSGKASVAYKQGFYDRPIIDEYALILRAWLQTLRPNWIPESGKFSVKLSHDIDWIHPFPRAGNIFRTLIADVIKRKNIKEAWKTVCLAIGQVFSPRTTSYYKNVLSLADLSHEYGLESAFYFMASKPDHPFDGRYNPKHRYIRSLIEALQDRGFEVGIHPGYLSFNDPERLVMEKHILDAVIGYPNYGGRQHYLRFQIPDTWQYLEQIGMVYDSSMGYADLEGFRCGTCHKFTPFDFKNNHQLNIYELPLIVMDGVLMVYRQFTPPEGRYKILELANRCKQVEGTFTFLWHNSSVHENWVPWYQMYRQVLEDLSKLQS